MEAQFAAGKEAKEAQDEDMKPTVESCTTLSREIAASQGLQAKIAVSLLPFYLHLLSTASLSSVSRR